MTCPVHHWPLKDKNGCWQCYEERRIAGKPQKEKKAYQIPKQSKKKQQREKELSKVRKEKKQQVRECQSCDHPEGPLDYSHILSVKHYPQYEAHPDNAVIECRRCHMIWEGGTFEEKQKQKSFQLKLNFILTYEPKHYNKLQLKS